MQTEKTAGYEKPVITRNNTGITNQFGIPRYLLPCDNIDGVPIKELVKQFGSPLWVVSEATLREIYKDLYRAFSLRYPKIIAAYSYKTNFLSGICALYFQEGAWAEVASGFEYDIAVKLGVPGNQIVFNGPYKTKNELRRAIKNNSMINIDSYQEIDNIKELARELGMKVKVGIRVNMQLDDMNWDRFGFNLESGQAIDACNQIISSEILQLTGFHVHAGTFILDVNLYRTLAEKLISLYRLVKDNPAVKIEYFDVGGGYASRNTLHYQWIPGEYACPSFDEYAEAICAPLVAELSKIAEMPLLIIEPGRALVNEAMHLITTVVSRKTLPDNSKGIVIDAGINLLPTSYWYRFNVHTTQTPPDKSITETVNIYGPLCMQLDQIQVSAYLPPVKAGDVLVIRDVGAYNFSQSLQFIQPRPAVVMITKGNIEHLRLPETTEYICQLERIPDHLLKKKA
jgi:diaminopimelate decarboxylase